VIFILKKMGLIAAKPWAVERERYTKHWI